MPKKQIKTTSIRLKLAVTFSLLFLVNGTSISQLPKKALKLIGTWQHVHDQGFETWRLEDNQLLGEAYRVTHLGDTVKIETMKLTYTAKTYQLLVTVFDQNDGRAIRFVSKKNRFMFENSNHDFPKAIVYKFSCWSRNKMEAYLYHPHKDKLPHHIKFRKVN